MTTPINPAFRAVSSPPVQEAFDWLESTVIPSGYPLLNVSQAAPTAPPPEALRRAIADAAMNNPAAHLYGPILGKPELRAQLASNWTRSYHGNIATEQVAITSGCNQAFTAVLSTLAGPRDEVILPTPWYFNHKMHLDMAGVNAVPLPTGREMLPDPDLAKTLINSKTRAIVLVTPNNPTGAEYPAELVRAFYDLAKSNRLALVIDATYRDFDSRDGAPHDLFQDPDWDQTLIQLYSYSKAYRLTGHRVGAIAASRARLSEVEKYLDTVTICPNQLGQIAALWGMQNLGDWLAGVAQLKGWKLLGLGAYFAYFKHPYSLPSQQLAPEILRQSGILLLPGSMFRPASEPAGNHELRVAFANIDHNGIKTLFSRLENLTL
ncbi:MAG: aminotransferase [Paracoccaceae bacterium]